MVTNVVIATASTRDGANDTKQQKETERTKKFVTIPFITPSSSTNNNNNMDKATKNSSSHNGSQSTSSPSPRIEDDDDD